MKEPIGWFAHHRVAANLLMLAIVAGGLLTLPTITREVFPDITPEILTVRVAYPGASPDEVEASVVTRIEDAVEGPRRRPRRQALRCAGTPSSGASRRRPHGPLSRASAISMASPAA